MPNPSYDIAVMKGDLTGRELAGEGLRVIDAAASLHGIHLNLTHYPFGGEHYLQTGELLPDSAIAEMRRFAAIYKGAMGHPDIKPGIVEKGIILKSRFAFDQAINLRPSFLLPNVVADLRKIDPTLEDGFGITVIRENTGDLYKGIGGIRKHPDGTIEYYQEMNYTDKEMRRLFQWSFDYVAKKSKEKGAPAKLRFLHKGNVVTFVFDPMLEMFADFSRAYKHRGVIADEMYIDAANGPNLFANPRDFEYIVTTNMFGDIITDLTARVFGGVGLGGSGNIHTNGGVSMFEPIHGSSPKDYGKHIVSPVSAILAGSMMFRHIGEHRAADSIEEAVKQVFREKKIPNLTISSGVPTEQQTDLIIDALRQTRP